MLTAELYPYAKTGGLADAVRALSDALYEMGHDLRVMIPEYTIGSDRNRLSEGSVSLGFSRQPYSAQKLSIGTSFPLIAISAPSYFQRQGIYSDELQSEFSDNAGRFSLFYRASLDVCQTLDWRPDIIHCHDWHAAPAMAYRRSCFGGPPNPAQAGILTIHNFGYRGFFSIHDIHYTGLEIPDMAPTAVTPTAVTPDTLSFLLCGLRNAERITTVSPSYANEIVGAPGDTFAEVLGARRDPVVGILNGIDYSVWNPKSDPFLHATYSNDNLAGKQACKTHLQRELGLAVDSRRPLIGLIGRLASQKGIEELLKPGHGCLETMCRTLPVQFAVLGTGEAWAEEELSRLSATYENVSATVGFSEALAHRIEAGADFFLMPSRYEPCGLNQMYSLAYATLPIVSRTGGLIDTVEDYEPATGDGTGFFIADQNPQSIVEAVRHAQAVWTDSRPHIDRMRHTAMHRRFTWEKAARSYEQVYRSSLG